MRQRSLLLVVLCAVALTHAEEDQLFSKACKSAPHASFIRSTTSCSHYLYCTKGTVGYEGICTKGLVFNPLTQVCGDLSKVDCSEYYAVADEQVNEVKEEVKQEAKEKVEEAVKEVEGVEEEEEEEQVSEEQPCESVEDQTFVKHLFACDKYYFCDNKEAHEGQCPDTFVFNSEEQICDHPENVVCEDLVVCDWQKMHAYLMSTKIKLNCKLYTF